MNTWDHILYIARATYKYASVDINVTLPPHKLTTTIFVNQPTRLLRKTSSNRLPHGNPQTRHWNVTRLVSHPRNAPFSRERAGIPLEWDTFLRLARQSSGTGIVMRTSGTGRAFHLTGLSRVIETHDVAARLRATVQWHTELLALALQFDSENLLPGSL